MIPLRHRTTAGSGPHARWLWALLLLLALAVPSTAEAQRKRRRSKRNKKPAPAKKNPAADDKSDKPKAEVVEKKTKEGREQVFDFTGLQLSGSMRTPQLLYFLDRANEELERASLERRSFVREMVRSIDQEGL